jgi:hypothetical protein
MIQEESLSVGLPGRERFSMVWYLQDVSSKIITTRLLKSEQSDCSCCRYAAGWLKVIVFRNMKTGEVFFSGTLLPEGKRGKPEQAGKNRAGSFLHKAFRCNIFSFPYGLCNLIGIFHLALIYSPTIRKAL